MSQGDCQEADFDKETDSDLQLDSRMIMLWGESRKKKSVSAKINSSFSPFLYRDFGVCWDKGQQDLGMECWNELEKQRNSLSHGLNSFFPQFTFMCSILGTFYRSPPVRKTILNHYSRLYELNTATHTYDFCQNKSVIFVILNSHSFCFKCLFFVFFWRV